MCIRDSHLPERGPVRVVERDGVAHRTGQQNPLAQLVQEIGLDRREGRVAAQIDDESAVLALPARPALDERCAAEKTVGQGLLARRPVFLRRSVDPDDPRAQRQIGVLRRKITFAVEPAVFLRAVVAFVERLHAELGHVFLERVQLAHHGAEPVSYTHLDVYKRQI